MTGRGWAYVGAFLGGAASIAANVAHSYVPPADAPVDWAPESGAVIGAVFWPLALFVAVEIFARTVWPAGRRWVLLRFAGLLPVAGVAAVVSYRHLSGLLDFYHDDALTVVIGPLAVDGLMVMATGALIATGARRSVVVAEPVPLLKPMVVAQDEIAALVADAGPSEPAPPAPTDSAVETAPEVAPTPKRSDPAPPDARPATKPARPHVRRRPASADKVAKAAARMPDATVAAIAAKAGVSESTARRYLPTARATGGDATATPATPIRPAPTPALADAA